MKYLLLVLLLLPGWAAWAQKTMTPQELVKMVRGNQSILVENNRFIDVAELTNLHWLEYLHFLRKDSTDAQYQAAKPDSLVWDRELSFNDPYVIYYMRLPRFRFYPVVGINYKQAVNYCHWRTTTVNQIIHSEQFLQEHPKLRRYNFRIDYRLPTVEEWESAAAGGLNPTQYPLGAAFPPVRGTKRYRQLLVPTGTKMTACLHDSVAAYQPATAVFYLDVNVREKYYAGNLTQAFSCPHDSGLTSPALDGAAIVEYVYAYPPNARGLYNMIGNVAELTATPGVAKGGSWAHSIKTFTIQTNLPYAEPHAWLGFRCAATVYISPKP